MFKIFKNFLFLFCLLSIQGCCYQMPTDDDVCILPTTNNPDVTRHKDTGIIPGVK